MAWIESHQTLAKHPKLFRLSDTLGIHPAQAIGHLHLFWWWAVDYARDGDLTRFRAGEIARACEWAGDPAQFVAALREAGWIDPDNTIHGWRQYTGRLLLFREAKQAKDAARQEAIRRQLAGGAPATPPRPAADSPASPAIPNPTEPNPTEPNPTLGVSEGAGGWPVPGNGPEPAMPPPQPAPAQVTPGHYASQPPSEAEFLSAVASVMLPIEEKMKCYHHFNAQGWVRGLAGRPITNLASVAAAWKADFEMRQLAAQLAGPKPRFPRDLKLQIDAVDAEMQQIRNRGQEDPIAGVVPAPRDKDRYADLKKKRRELRKLLTV